MRCICATLALVFDDILDKNLALLTFFIHCLRHEHAIFLVDGLDELYDGPARVALHRLQMTGWVRLEHALLRLSHATVWLMARCSCRLRRGNSFRVLYISDEGFSVRLLLFFAIFSATLGFSHLLLHQNLVFTFFYVGRLCRRCCSSRLLPTSTAHTVLAVACLCYSRLVLQERALQMNCCRRSDIDWDAAWML